MLCSFPLILALLAQAPPADARDVRAARLELMKQSVASYEIQRAGGREGTYRLRPEPVLRFTNPVGDSEDGAIFFWLDGDGRPGVAAQVFLSRWRRAWVHDFTSLSDGPLVAATPSGPVWTPGRGGVTFRPLPGAPRPADTPEGRLRQMNDIVRGFALSDDFRQKGWQALRPMSKPFLRYGKPGTAVVDGVAFCFALGTDPEAFLLLEARAGEGDAPSAWHFAFAPQTTYALKSTWRGEPTWSSPDIRNPWDPTATFFGRTYGPAE